MQDFIVVTGIIIKQSPVLDNDRRVTILTNSRGKISAFARGARKPNSRLAGTTCPYCFGKFKLYEGKDAYTISEAEIENYFEGFLGDIEGSCYSAYFAEIVDYYCRENNDEREMMKLFYTSLLALLSEKIPNRLVRCIFELKSIIINGEYPGIPENSDLSDSAIYTIEYIRKSDMKSLYTFNVSENVLSEIEFIAKKYCNMLLDHTFKSLQILESII